VKLISADTYLFPNARRYRIQDYSQLPVKCAHIKFASRICTQNLSQLLDASL